MIIFVYLHIHVGVVAEPVASRQVTYQVAARVDGISPGCPGTDWTHLGSALSSVGAQAVVDQCHIYQALQGAVWAGVPCSLNQRKHHWAFIGYWELGRQSR